MRTSTPANGSPHLEVDGHTSLKAPKYDDEAKAESELFDNLSKLWADVRRSRLQWLESAMDEERLLEQDLNKAQEQRNEEFLKVHKVRRELFEKVHTTEIRKFENSHAQRELEFKKNHKAREEQHQQRHTHSSKSLAVTEQDVDSEHLKLQRQAEDDYEASQLRHKHNDKIAQREREDSYHLSEVQEKANHLDRLKQLRQKFDINGEVLQMSRKQSWRGQEKDIRVQIEQSQAILMLKLFGPSDFQDPSKPKLDIPTPPPDLSTSPIDQASIIPTEPEKSPDKPLQNAITLTIDQNPSLFEEFWQDDTAQEHHSTPRKKSRAKSRSRPSAEFPNADTNPGQRSQPTTLDECQIQAVERIFEELGEDCRRKDLWDRVSEAMKEKGHLRDAKSAAAKWSSILRQVCEDRGYAWAESVMKKAPYKTTRKRRTMSTDDEIKPATPTSTSSRPGKRLKRVTQDLQHRDTVEVHRNATRTKKNEQGKSFYGTCISMDFSYDVTQLDWSPDGKQFLVGSMALEEPIQENKPCNLVLGSMNTKTLKEMQNTHISYGDPNTSKCLYRTVTAAQFSAKGDHALTAGYDKYVRIWDLRGDEESACISKIEHENKVILMALGKHTNLLATGIEAGPESLQVWRGNEDFTHIESVGTPYKKVKEFDEYPMSLAFGTHQATQNWLVAGFAWDDMTCGGRLDVWSIDQGYMTERHFKPNHSQVFEVAWIPSGKGFIAGISSSMPSSKERSCVQFYNINEQDSYLKLSCPAADMNIVTICPYQEDLVTASCTDGKVYVWDIRNPKTVLHTLAHGTRLQENCGVWMTEWLDQNSLFTGSSDGFLKRWDPRLSAQDVFVEDVYECDAEIMSGRFSPDKSALILGDGNKGLHLLRRGIGEQPPVEEFNFVRANNNQAGDRATVGITNREGETSIAGSLESTESPLSPAPPELPESPLSPTSPDSSGWPHYSPGFK